MTRFTVFAAVLISGGGALAAEKGADPDASVYASWPLPQGRADVSAVIGADICGDFVPVLNFKTCPFTSDWVSAVDLDRDGVSEYFMRAQAPWEGSGASEVRIYRLRGFVLERIYRGLAETVEPLYGLGQHKSGVFPRILVSIRVGFCGRQFVYLDFSGNHYREGEAYIAERDHPDCAGHSDEPPP